MTHYQRRRLEILWPRRRKVYRNRKATLGNELLRRAQCLLEIYWRGV